MIVWVVLSDCGLNGPWIHAVRTTEPSRDELERWMLEIAPTTGYQHTALQEWDTDTGQCTKRLVLVRDSLGAPAAVWSER